MWLKRVYSPFLIPVGLTECVSVSYIGVTWEVGKGQFNGIKSGLEAALPMHIKCRQTFRV